MKNNNIQIQEAIVSTNINKVKTAITKIKNTVKNDEEKNAIFTCAVKQALETGTKSKKQAHKMATIIITIIKQGFNIDNIRTRTEKVTQ